MKTKNRYYFTPIDKAYKRQYLYQLSFIAEFYQYFDVNDVVVPHTNGKERMTYSLDLAFFPVCYTYEDYFANCIKSPERALVRKALKNGYECREINYDDYLEDIHRINISKESRQGEKMSEDYVRELKPRQKIVGKIGQEIHSFGCFDINGKLIAYYMFEKFGKEIIHTVKGICHADHLKFGVMNCLFAFSVSKLYKYYPLGDCVICYGGMSLDGGGLSRFKRNVGCCLGCLTIKGNKDFYVDLKKFNKEYKLHGDTGLNFVIDYLH